LIFLHIKAENVLAAVSEDEDARLLSSAHIFFGHHRGWFFDGDIYPVTPELGDDLLLSIDSGSRHSNDPQLFPL
jgi:hypothetical protein